MPNMREDVLAQVFRAGAIRSLSLTVVDGRVLVSYLTGEGEQGCVYTKAGNPKFYRVETALKFLHELGVQTCTVDMTRWTGAQVALEV